MIDRRPWNGKIETFEVYTKDLDAAKAVMTGRWVGFKSKVVDVISDGERALITVESCGMLKFARSRWDKYIIPPEQRRATGVQALEYKIHQIEKRRGRPKRAA